MDNAELVIKVFKLVSGETIIGMVDVSVPPDALLTIIKPVVVDFNKYYTEDGYTETVSIRKWIMVSGDDNYMIPARSIISVSNVNAEFIGNYTKLCKEYHTLTGRPEDEEEVEHDEYVMKSSSKYLH